MRKNSFVAKDHISAINIFKIAQKGKSFSKTELKQTLKNGGIPSNEVFINALRKSPILAQVGKDQFMFATPKPIYYGWLETVYKNYHTLTTKYRNTYKEKKKMLSIA